MSRFKLEKKTVENRFWADAAKNVRIANNRHPIMARPISGNLFVENWTIVYTSIVSNNT